MFLFCPGCRKSEVRPPLERRLVLVPRPHLDLIKAYLREDCTLRTLVSLERIQASGAAVYYGTIPFDTKGQRDIFSRPGVRLSSRLPCRSAYGSFLLMSHKALISTGALKSTPLSASERMVGFPKALDKHRAVRASL